jgi:hypothetical protein
MYDRVEQQEGGCVHFNRELKEINYMQYIAAHNVDKYVMKK